MSRLTVTVNRIVINDEEYTPEQLEAAVNCAFKLAMAYAIADPKNGGGEKVEWEDVNDAHKYAVQAFDPKGIEDIKSMARSENSYHPADWGVLTAEQHDACSLWTQEMSEAAEREGWNIFDLGEPLNTRIERCDEAGILESDDVARLMVRTGTGAHHSAARKIIHACNPEEWALLEKAADQAWDANAERLTKEAGLGDGGINPNATSILDIFDESSQQALDSEGGQHD